MTSPQWMIDPMSAVIARVYGFLDGWLAILDCLVVITCLFAIGDTMAPPLSTIASLGITLIIGAVLGYQAGNTGQTRADALSRMINQTVLLHIPAGIRVDEIKGTIQGRQDGWLMVYTNGHNVLINPAMVSRVDID